MSYENLHRHPSAHPELADRWWALARVRHALDNLSLAAHGEIDRLLTQAIGDRIAELYGRVGEAERELAEEAEEQWEQGR